MTPRELFGTLLRLLGVWLILSALQFVPMSIFAISSAQRQPGSQELLIGLSLMVMPMIAGCCLLFWPEWIVSLVYPPRHEAEPAAGLKPIELFGVFIKAIGVWYLAGGINRLPTAFMRMQPYGDPSEFASMVLNSFSGPAIEMIIGAFLLFKTDWLIGIAYRPRAAVAVFDADESETAPP